MEYHCDLQHGMYKAWAQDDITNVPGLYFYLVLTLMMFGIETWLVHTYTLSKSFLAINSTNSRTHILISLLLLTLGEATQW